MSDRTIQLERETAEPTITGKLHLDGDGQTDIDTGLGVLDHMLNALGMAGGNGSGSKLNVPK